MGQPIHSKLINAAAREILNPIGLQQKGQSRLWLDDHGWWLILVEFQPSSREPGAFLNVGLNWLWSERNYFAYDEGHRVGRFTEFQTEEQFVIEIKRVVRRAAKEIQNNRRTYSSIEAAARLLGRKWNKDSWGRYHAAVAAGLCGKHNQATRFFNELIQEPSHTEWHKLLKQRAVQLMGSLDDMDELRHRINGLVIQTRNQLGLGQWDLPYL
ncbi:MAG: hypothetical protein JW704_10005 [Anaerolineaceae bacterium]|nr:hypothetical protein [Anaerolineaceae bacterium]